MYIDKYLSWDFHIHELCKRLSRANGIISKLRYNAPLSVRLKVYFAIFHSDFSYGCNIWGLTTEENIQKIEILQRKCVRLLTFSPYNCHTNKIFIDLGLLKLRDIIKVEQIKLVYKFQNSNLPTDLMGLFSFTSDISTTNLELKRNMDNLYIPGIRSKTYGLKSVKYFYAKLWNDTFVNGITIASGKTLT